MRAANVLSAIPLPAARLHEPALARTIFAPVQGERTFSSFRHRQGADGAIFLAQGS